MRTLHSGLTGAIDDYRCLMSIRFTVPVLLLALQLAVELSCERPTDPPEPQRPAANTAGERAKGA